MADDDEWKYELDDLSDAEGDDGGDGTGGEELTGPSEIPVEPESWSIEGAAFVVLGVVATLFVFLRFAVG